MEEKKLKEIIKMLAIDRPIMRIDEDDKTVTLHLYGGEQIELKPAKQNHSASPRQGLPKKGAQPQ